MEKSYFLISHGDISLNVCAPVENGMVITNEYCPQSLVTGGLSFVSAVNGEEVEEFFNDCTKQVIAMSMSNEEKIVDRHIAGLMAVVMDHIARHGRLIFGDLLIYVDCFSLLLKAAGLSDYQIRTIYPKVTKLIVDFYPDYIKATANLVSFVSTPIYGVLCKLAGN